MSEDLDGPRDSSRNGTSGESLDARQNDSGRVQDKEAKPFASDTEQRPDVSYSRPRQPSTDTNEEDIARHLFQQEMLRALKPEGQNKPQANTADGVADSNSTGSKLPETDGLIEFPPGKRTSELTMIKEAGKDA